MIPGDGNSGSSTSWKVHMADALTLRQREILDFISASIVERGFPPTLREIGEHFQIRSTNGVNDHLKPLEKKGHLRRADLKSRAILPILPLENATDTVKVDPVLLGGHREVFGLRIVGESMIEDGIFDGDYVFVKKTPRANPGDIVVAMIEGEATVKRYYPEGDTIRFQPANSNMVPIFVRRSDFKSVDIIGIVVGIYRKL